VTKLLDKEIKKERIRMCKAFIAIIAVTPWPSWDNFLTVDESAGGEELASWPHPPPGSPQRSGEGEGKRNFMVANFAKELQGWYKSCEKCMKTATDHIEKSKKYLQNGLTKTVF
jgi:hypothetical protein